MEGKHVWGAGGRGMGGVIEGQSVGDEGLKLIWINTNTSSNPLPSLNLNRDQLEAPVTMTTSVNHTVAVGFQMGTDGAGLGLATQTSECKVHFCGKHAFSYYIYRKVDAGQIYSHSQLWQIAEIVAIDDVESHHWQSSTHKLFFQFHWSLLFESSPRFWAPVSQIVALSYSFHTWLSPTFKLILSRCCVYTIRAAMISRLVINN